MPFSTLSRRHRLLLGLAGLFAFFGAFATALTTRPELDRDALMRLAAEAALEPAATGSIR